MTLCPVAIAVGCKKCPIFTVCPAKSLIGDYKPDEQASPKSQAKTGATGAKKKR